jgi:hypothetical protein
MHKNLFRTEQLKLRDPNTIGDQVGSWFDRKAQAGTPVETVISVSFFLTQEMPKSAIMNAQQQSMPEFIFNFVVVYTEKSAA